ncbi:MAG: hypothetical protein RLY93_02215 [Sumerlaeia bacterium]
MEKGKRGTIHDGLSWPGLFAVIGYIIVKWFFYVFLPAVVFAIIVFILTILGLFFGIIS